MFSPLKQESIDSILIFLFTIECILPLFHINIHKTLFLPYYSGSPSDYCKWPRKWPGLNQVFGSYFSDTFYFFISLWRAQVRLSTHLKAFVFKCPGHLIGHLQQSLSFCSRNYSLNIHFYSFYRACAEIHGS